jgi:hypothetical protein
MYVCWFIMFEQNWELTVYVCSLNIIAIAISLMIHEAPYSVLNCAVNNR